MLVKVTSPLTSNEMLCKLFLSNCLLIVAGDVDDSSSSINIIWVPLEMHDVFNLYNYFLNVS